MIGLEQVPPASEPILLRRVWRGAVTSDLGLLVLLALALVVVHTLTNGQYGFHRDELMELDDARHLAWGYVSYPPLTPFVGRVELELFGTSLVGFRLFAALSQAVVLVLVGLAARELGGGRFAQFVAAVAVGIGGHSLVNGTYLQYTPFDYLWWVLVAYFVIRLLKSNDPRWWVAIGAAIGLGMMTKYTMVFLVAGVLGGVLLTPARRYLKSFWLWCGVTVALLVFLPNLVWQTQHHFVYLEFLKAIHTRDVAMGRAGSFLLAQLWKCANPVTVPLWGAGLWYLFAVRADRRFQMLGWMYVIPLVAFVAARGRDYYLAGAYPMLFAAGSVWGEQWVQSLSARNAETVRSTSWWTLAVAGLCTAAVTLPLAPFNSAWWRLADRVNGNFNYEIGYRELVERIAKVRDTLPMEERARLGILVADVGEAGAVNLYGPPFSLPRAISGMNSYWLRGFGNPPPETLIVVGMNRNFLDKSFASCQLVGHFTDGYEKVNTALNGYTDIFVCRRLHQPWPAFWKHLQSYG